MVEAVAAKDTELEAAAAAAVKVVKDTEAVKAEVAVAAQVAVAVHMAELEAVVEAHKVDKADKADKELKDDKEDKAVEAEEVFPPIRDTAVECLPVDKKPSRWLSWMRLEAAAERIAASLPQP